MANNDKVIQLDPTKILADDNTRFGLLDFRKDALKASIVAEGGVQEPVSVAVLDEPVDGMTHRLLKGFYRHAAVTELNKEGAGLTLPCIVRDEPADELTRIRLQVTENAVRTAMSPMDTAIAIRRLIDEGMPRLEVRTLFARPTGKKGSTLVPASNSWLNIHLSFLDFTKAVQTKIHNGTVGVAAAYELSRVAPEKQAAVLARAEEEREKEVAQEEKAEAKFLKEESKLAEARAKEEQAAAELTAAKTEAETAAERHVAAKLSYTEVASTPGYLTMKPDEKKALTEAMKAAQAEVKAAEKLEKDALKKLEKLTPVSEAATSAASTAKEKLAKARAEKTGTGKQGAAKKPAVGPANVKKAAAKEGAGAPVPLNLADIRSFVKELATPGGMPKVTEIGKLIKSVVDGGLTPKECYRQLAVVTGEATAPKAKK